MTDIEKMYGKCEITKADGETAVLAGSAPVVMMRNYQKEVIAYTKGYGRLFCSLKGYEPCHNAKEVIDSIGYDAERDIANPTGSVFCTQGAGFLVEWNRVKEYMHIEGYLQNKEAASAEVSLNQVTYAEERAIGLEEIDQIISGISYANQGKKSAWKKRKTAHESYYEPVTYVEKPKEIKEEYLLVDGYNIIFTWSELKELTKDNMDGARMKLLDLLSNYQGIRKCQIIVVFDAYLVQGHVEEIIDYHNIHMVYTKEAQTADHYIEKFAYNNKNKYSITVATSDGLQQVIIRGTGSKLLSARELKSELERANESIKEAYQEMQKTERNYLEDVLSPKEKQQIQETLKI